MDLEKWLKEYEEKITGLFHSRILFLGLQGSCSRGEADENSGTVDIKHEEVVNKTEEEIANKANSGGTIDFGEADEKKQNNPGF